ncbi:hypothetical protein HFO98_31620 [Rhizobium leguminosarum]|uniref:hypothetical protein n=1 Tax=Rhizobium leguminosarum TaxID=384 RepID=UPI001C947CFE|nr:hypothetical protein [Rhizobium leguminosarum]MBY5412898.1 hypothetical protein [Rhizobium leguminosarum]
MNRRRESKETTSPSLESIVAKKKRKRANTILCLLHDHFCSRRMQASALISLDAERIAERGGGGHAACQC